LNDLYTIEFYSGQGKWGCKARWKDRLRRVKYYLRPFAARHKLPHLAPNRVLVTWSSDNYRISGLVLPVLGEFDRDECLVLAQSPEVLALVPTGMQTILSRQAMWYDLRAWRKEYRRCRLEWQRRTRTLCRKHCLPVGAYDRIMLHMMLSSQAVAGCFELLQAARPAAILTEADRHALWPCLVLAARSLEIPTLTLVHGVLNESAVGYVPVLADRVLCWGDMQREQFIAAGECPDKVIVAGCPRLTRELAVTPVQARERLGLTSENPVVMLGTNPWNERDCLSIAQLFCGAMAGMDGVSALVRLHPAERLKTYESVAKRYPAVRFLANSDATLDETLAAADLVVVPNSGFGSDALVKRRPVVVLDLPTLPLGHGADLINRAGCPRVTIADQLAAAIRRLLRDGPARQEQLALADRYLAGFCAAFGRDAARKVAVEVRRTAKRLESPAFDNGATVPLGNTHV